MNQKTLYILDGHAMIFRAHYAFIARPLFNSKGINTSAITGFTRSLWDIIVNHQPSHLAVSFDKSNITFRNEMYPQYKAQRDATPEDIRIAIPYIKEIVKAFNIPIFEIDNYEADDVIGTLAKQAEKQGFKVFMVTPDKDFGQLVTENIKIYKPARQGNGIEILGIPEVLARWDIDNVDQVQDMIGLQGDSIDNIPGIPGIGPKTAAKLLKTYHSIENLLVNTQDLKGKMRENLETYADQGLLSKRLAIINTEVPITFDPDETEMNQANKTRLTELFAELEFRTLAQSILGNQSQAGVQQALFPVENSSSSQAVIDKIAPNQFKNTDQQYLLVEDAAARASLIEELKSSPAFCFDTETTSIQAVEAELVGMSFSTENGKAYFILLPKGRQETLTILEEFRDVFEDPGIIKIAQNIKYDVIVLKNYGIRVNGIYHDTMLFHYLLNPELRHNMDYMAETYLSYKTISYDELTEKKGQHQKKLRDVNVEKLKNYAAEDADITLRLHEYLYEKLKKEKLDPLYFDVEEPVIKVLAEMEFTGIRLNSDFLIQYGKELTEQILELQSTIHTMAGAVFNIDSPKQVGEILFDVMKIPYRWGKTKTGQYSTNEVKLGELEKDHEIVSMILEYRGLMKLKSTYVDALPRMVNPRTGRIHSSFNQALAATGRLSSNNPNLQNIPIKTEAGRKVREAFIPADENHVLLGADYSQIELRLIAHMSGDEAMLEAFNNDQDIHRATAARVFDMPYDAVTSDQRRQAKTVNFSIIYGAGATNLSQQLDIPRKEASELISAYFNQYKGLKKYMDETVEFARKNGYVETLLGRKRGLRDINSRNRLAQAGAERIAINTPIQGSAADMIKLAMIHIHHKLQEKNLQSKLILQVHDELMFDVPKEEVEEMKILVQEEMVNALPGLKVPILVEVGTGNTWLEAH
ncbi:MAG TPA: DNA polymerase I [Membranihabitans sp.]|nr:DNA polymerase I [Membranihabitans sp.]